MLPPEPFRRHSLPPDPRFTPESALGRSMMGSVWFSVVQATAPAIWSPHRTGIATDWPSPRPRQKRLVTLKPLLHGRGSGLPPVLKICLVEPHAMYLDHDRTELNVRL
jgi:hypothetical protein